MTAPMMIMIMMLIASPEREEQPWYSFPIPAYAHNPTQAPRKRTPKRTRTKQSAYRDNNNNRPDDDNNDNDDVDCFPRQDKQPVPQQQDISPTAPTANANNASPSFIESFTDTATENCKNKSYDNIENNTNVINPTIHPHVFDVACFHRHDKQPTDNDDDDDTYDDYAYDAYDEYEDSAYDDGDDDDSYASSTSEDYYNHDNVIIDMYGNKFTIDDNDNITPYADDDNDKPVTIQTAQRQINAILAGRTNTSAITAFTNQAQREYDEFFLRKNVNRTLPAASAPVPTTYAKNDDHGAFLYHRWNTATTNKNSTIRPCTNKPRTAGNSKTVAHAPINIPVKDDPSITPTLETLCTVDTRSSDPTYNDTADAILNITIWNQPIVQYKVPLRSNTRNRSQHPSTAVRYALIGVYNKLDPSELPCLLPFFTSIICVVLSCVIYFDC